MKPPYVQDQDQIKMSEIVEPFAVRSAVEDSTRHGVRRTRWRASGEPATAIPGTLALVTSGLRALFFWGGSRLGSIADLPLCPVQLGYLNGLPTVMVVSPVSELGGFSGSGDTPAEQTWDVAVDVADR